MTKRRRKSSDATAPPDVTTTTTTASDSGSTDTQPPPAKRAKLNNKKSKGKEASEGVVIVRASSAAGPKLSTRYTAIGKQFPCRQSVITQLVGVIGRRGGHIPTAFVYGQAATGKSAISKQVLVARSAPYAIVNCIECYNSRLAMEAALRGLVATAVNDVSELDTRCASFNTFILHLRKFCDAQTDAYTPVIVFDKAERLRTMPGGFLSLLLRLPELVERHVGVLLVSEIVWDRVRPLSAFVEPVLVHFPSYTMSELEDIVKRDVPSGSDPALYGSFVHLICDVLASSCRDLNELRHLCLLLYPVYARPVERGEIEKTNVAALYQRIGPYFRRALERVYLRNMSKSELAAADTERDSVPGSISSTAGSENTLITAALELPTLSKYLLVASFYGSYNPARYDTRYFTAKITRKRRDSKAANRQLGGPKPFPLERLLAIFYAILDAEADPTAELFLQISSLVSLNLLEQTSGPSMALSPKYRCNASLDLILSICKSIRFNLYHYLHSPK